jgi:hypothetical protein
MHTLLTATIAFYGQIYFDFAGYSSMAIGTARLFGYRFPPNFNYPYRAASVTEFWRRWHMSLSFWLRDYLYIPLGGNRGGTLFVCRNLMITMLLGGLWHGAAWNYVVWGALHGVGRGSAPGRGLDPRGYRDRSYAWERSPQVVAVAPVGPVTRVERARSLVRARARGDAGRTETVHLLPVLRRFTRPPPEDVEQGVALLDIDGVKRVRCAKGFAAPAE